MSEQTLHILMPVYNCAAYVAQAIDSVRAQTHTDFLLHIVDDGSTDQTLQICQSYEKRDPRINVTAQPNRGVANTINSALQQLNSEWVFNMHGDDLMLPNRLERQLAFISENPDLSVVSTLVKLIDANGREIGQMRSPMTSRHAVQEAAVTGKSIAFSHPASAFKPAVVKAVGGYRQEFWPAEDTELFNRIATAGYAVLVQNEPLLLYRIHGQAASTRKARLMVQKLAWMMECLQQRLAKKPEPTWEQFLAGREKLPLLKRWNNQRIETSRTLYQTAHFYFATRRRPAFFLAMTAAILLEPSQVLGRVLPRLLPRRSKAGGQS